MGKTYRFLATAEGMVALQRDSYFVAVNDNDSVLDHVCRALELRGVEGVQRLTSRCTRRRPHCGFSELNVSPAAAAGELFRSAAEARGRTP